MQNKHLKAKFLGVTSEGGYELRFVTGVKGYDQYKYENRGAIGGNGSYYDFEGKKRQYIYTFRLIDEDAIVKFNFYDETLEFRNRRAHSDKLIDEVNEHIGEIIDVEVTENDELIPDIRPLLIKKRRSKSGKK